MKFYPCELAKLATRQEDGTLSTIAILFPRHIWVLYSLPIACRAFGFCTVADGPYMEAEFDYGYIYTSQSADGKKTWYQTRFVPVEGLWDLTLY